MSSSEQSWRSTSTAVMPRFSETGAPAFEPDGALGAVPLAVMIEGRFETFFEESPLLASAPAGAEDDAEAEQGVQDGDEAAEESPEALDIGSVIERSPESARLIVIGSSAMAEDQTLRMIGSADGTVYSNSIELLANLVDAAVEDQALLSIRSRGHFNRTLPSMTENAQRVWEYVNYGVAALAVLAALGVNAQRRARRRRAQLAWLQEEAA